MDYQFYIQVLLSLSNDFSWPTILNTYLKYQFPGSAELYKILKGRNKKTFYKIPDIDLFPVPEEYSEISIIDFMSIVLAHNNVSNNKIHAYNAKLKYPDLSFMSAADGHGIRNLNREAYYGRLDPVIGRENEIDKIIQIINNRKKRNPVLIGDAGVGKTAIIEGLASRINNKNVPISMLNKVILEIDITQFTNSPNGANEFKNFMNLLSKDPNVIAFIDEAHMLDSKSFSSNINLMDVIKPILASGQISLVAATTETEFREIQKDKAMARRLQPVYIKETNDKETINILKNILSIYTKYHRIDIDSSIIDNIVRASNVLSGYNPDKAITLMDNILSTVKVNNNAVHTEATLDDVINILGKKYKIRPEFIQESDTYKAYAMNFMDNVKLLSYNRVEKLFKSIIRARINNVRHKVSSVTTLIGDGVLTERIAINIAKVLEPEGQYILMNGSEFQDTIAKTRILGAPPGYIGHNDPTFFSKIVNKPLPIIISNFNIMSDDIKDMITDVMKKGYLETSSGEIIIFRNIDVIITTAKNTISGSFIDQKSSLSNNISSITDIILLLDILNDNIYKNVAKKYNKSISDLKFYIARGYIPDEIEKVLNTTKSEQIYI